MSQDISLSVAIITKNEMKRLPDCLRSVAFVKDIVVVDSGSTDGTVEMAREFGCRVYVEDWKGDGPQKQSAVSKCLNDWVLVLDADERLTPEAQAQAIAIVANPESADAYSFTRKSIFHGRWIGRGGWWPDRVVRLFRRSRGEYRAITHGRWITQGKLMHLDASLEHYSFTGYADLVARMNDYSTLRANELYASGARTNPYAAVAHALFMFFKSYVLGLGFLAGFDGLLIALTKSGGSFLKYAKLVELKRTGKRGIEQRVPDREFQDAAEARSSRGRQ